MERNLKRLVGVLVLLATAGSQGGCSAALVTASSDPAKKLADATYLLNESERPLPAERLIVEAQQIYQASGDNRGLAEAYRMYAIFLKSAPVTNSAGHYSAKGFLDPSVTFSSRFSGALEYLSRAEAIYVSEGMDDKLSNVYFQMAMASTLNGDLSSACKYLDRSAAAGTAYAQSHPNAPVTLPPGYSSFRDAINDAKSKVGCPEGA